MEYTSIRRRNLLYQQSSTGIVGHKGSDLVIQRFDLHTHTYYSDGEGSVQDSVDKAVELGLSLLAITDHFDEPLPHRITKDQLEELIQIVKGNTYPIPVLLGVETGIEGTIPPEWKEHVDLIIRSVHYLRRPVKASSPYDPLYWEEYKNEVLQLLQRPGDVAGHIEGYLPLPLGDLKTTFDERRAMEREIAEKYFDKEWQEAVAKLASKNNIAIEIHSFTKTPRIDFIRLCQEHGCLFSVGSDAHPTENIGKIDWAFEIIEELNIPQNQLLPYVKGWL